MDTWLGLQQDADDRWSFTLTPDLARFDGKLYGGTGIAVTTALLEHATGRDALWATAQFVGSADVGDRIELHVEVLAQGRRTSQVRVTGRCDGRTVIAALGAAGEARANAIEAHFGTMPDVPGPDDAGPWMPRVPFEIPMDRPSWLTITELREVQGMTPRPLWARLRDRALTRAALGFLADMVPSAVMQAAGRPGAGTSLDNAMRFGPPPDCEWLLIDFDPYFASGGYVHGGARLWSEDGTLVGIASQTASAILFD